MGQLSILKPYNLCYNPFPTGFEVDASIMYPMMFLLKPPFCIYMVFVQAGHRGGVTQTVHCPVHLLPSIQRLSRKIQIESGANYVFANCKVRCGHRGTGGSTPVIFPRLPCFSTVEQRVNASFNVNAPSPSPVLGVRNTSTVRRTPFPQ